MGVGFGETLPVVVVGALAAVPVAGTGGAAAAGFSLFGGGYVDQKWRPHFGQTQNWSGFQVSTDSGSRSSIWVPQR